MGDRLTKAIYNHCKDAYAAMEEEAVTEQIGTNNYKVYTGFLTRLMQDKLQLPVAYYSHVTAELRRMGCIEQLKRGGGSAPSKWFIIKPPNEADFLLTPKLEKGIKGQSVIEQRLRNLEERMDKFEIAIGTMNAPEEDDES